MRYPLHGRANELQAMSRLRPRAAVGLLTGHTSQRADLYKLGHTERQECLLCGYDKEDSGHVCHCLVLACERYKIWGSMFVKPEDLEKVRVGSLLSLVANTGIGLVSASRTTQEIQWNSNDLGIVRVRYGTIRYFPYYYY